MIRSWFKSDPLKPLAEALFAQVSAAARQPALFAQHGVPDTVEGRFEALSLHVFLVARRLDALGQGGKDLAQRLMDRFFFDLDDAMRAIGIGDTSVGKKIKTYARNFYGRVDAYSAGLSASAEADVLPQAILRNLLGGDAALAAQARALAAYIRRCAVHLEELDLARFQDGSKLFPAEFLS
jgi:cytochrome b pre-mRNA-processing protein 3